MERASQAATGYHLHAACEPCDEIAALCRDVLRRFTAVKSLLNWKDVLNIRIKLSYAAQNPALVWLDDKVEQVNITARLCGRQMHLPIYGHAAAGDSVAEEALLSTVKEKVTRGEPIVVKPRHGSNSKHVTLWPKPQEADEAAVLKSVHKALVAQDRTWKKESWNQNAVPKGAVLQPMYSAMHGLEGCSSGDLAVMLARPLELKVQVLFGEVVGGNLNTFVPCNLWVSREGVIHLWDEAAHGLLKRHHGPFERLPVGVLELLQQALRRDWSSVRESSEQLARSAGLDELRVDWLLGDERWGPRIGETTFMGTFALDILLASVELARAYATGHLARLESK